uniref:ATPase AAA-type core domain-containing protein n=1 Tax=Candidatus Kentrum sp. LFY TaxID=2126342 RepID=A0A450V369_9GAMM|nr:MAG: hypothetical protein BECKLFY1418A_GA0070994_10952 [Candidatus Kentron sp. LFY]
MLIELAVANFRSIRDEQRLSLVAGRERTHRDTNVFEPAQPKGRKRLRLLRSAALYGPNASGKTNLVRALVTMRRVVLESQQRIGQLPMEPFMFDPETRSQPTLLEVVVMVDGVRYQYGFSATDERIHDEWLFAFPKGRAQRWFEREFFPDEGRDEFSFSDKLTGGKEVWRQATRPDALFLSTAVQLNSQQLLPLFNWFRDELRVVGIDGWPSEPSMEWCQNDNKQRILKFLQVADFAIADLRQEEINPPDAGGPIFGTLSEVRELLNRGWKKAYELTTIHRTSDGQLVELNIEDESDGTQKMFNLAAPWLDALDQGRVLITDELHDNLHPFLVEFLIRLFHSPETNPKGAQLVFTSHDTSILSDENLRRDQIWFCKRDNEGQFTRLYPLTRFKPPKGIANLEQDYLVGGYGAVPFLRNPSRIFED